MAGLSFSARYVPNVKRQGHGIYALPDIKDRCIDMDGCWHWPEQRAGNGVPMVGVPAGVIEGRGRHTAPLRRIAYVMSGKTLRAGQIVWTTCGKEDCVNPAHMTHGTRKQWGEWLVKTGSYKHSPSRAVAARIQAVTQAAPVQLVRDIEIACANDDLSQHEIARLFGVSQNLVSKISNGKHLHQSAHELPGASVFSWGLVA
jgi:hypothetical protein